MGDPSLLGPTQKKIFKILTCRRAKKAFPRPKFSKMLYCLGGTIQRFSENTDFCLLGKIEEGRCHAKTQVTDVGEGKNL